MKVSKHIEVAVNDHINSSIDMLMKAEFHGPDQEEATYKQKIALTIAGMLMAAKTSLVQALITVKDFDNEPDLDSPSAQEKT